MNADVDEQFTDATGTVRRTAPETLTWIRARLGTGDRDGGQADGDPSMLPIVVRAGQPWPLASGHLILEGGGEVAVTADAATAVALGYHTFAGDDGERRVIVAPRSCPLPPRREWGWSTQLYAMRSRGSWGVGDLGDLRTIAKWSSEEQGAGFLLVNPLNAVAPGSGQQASPYSPTSRRFLNPLYADVRRLRVGERGAQRFAELESMATKIGAERLIDRDRVVALKMEALELAHASAPDASVDVDDESLRDFATWTVLAERFGGDWRHWPTEYQHPRSRAVAAFASEHAGRVAFHAWTQGVLRGQLADVCAHTRLVQDLPIGFDPGGADAWCWRDLLALDATVGAPPDEFNTAGQDWGLTPFVPARLAAAGYEPFIQTIRACLADDGALRIDHVMGLFRLWWVPEGHTASDGAFVRYPADDLLAILALESHRARAIIIGEDLGTVDERALTALAEHNVLSYKLLWFEEQHPSAWNPKALAAVSTHDLPTVAGIWDGTDLESQIRMDLGPNVEGMLSIRDRLVVAGGVATDAHVFDAVREAYSLLAKSPAMLLAASLDDAIAESERPNIPGADGQRANWCLALPLELEEIQAGQLAADIARTLAEGIAAAPPSEH